MTSPKKIVDELKYILENSSDPYQLDEHGWVESLFVTQFMRENPAYGDQSPGCQLMAALEDVFRDLMPSIPPRRGKRLDTNWGQFGILGAMYFAPFQFGTVRPASLRDAWGRIDQVIPLYVFGKTGDQVAGDDLRPYLLVSEEYEIAPSSTISDWHVKGLTKLAQALLEREQHLALQPGHVSSLLTPGPARRSGQSGADKAEAEELPAGGPGKGATFYRKYGRWLWMALGLTLVLFVGWKSYRVLTLYRAFRQDVDQLQGLISGGSLAVEDLVEVGPVVHRARGNVEDLRAQVAPFRWGGRLFGWLPKYGGDLAAAGDLLDLACGLLIAGDEGLQATEPLLAGLQPGGEGVSITSAAQQLVTAQPQLEAAVEALDMALERRDRIEIDRLSAKTRPLLEKIDPYLPLLRSGLGALSSLPKLLGAADAGPQTYLVLIQNEDELRATGGFITAVAVVTVEQGKIIAFKVEDSYAMDDFSKDYPLAPWQMQEYMFLGYLTLRDSNWSPDFRVSSQWAEHLYAYYSAHSVDGVIAIDQEVVRILLEAIGPLTLVGTNEAVTAENVIEFMRSEKDQYQAGDPQRKAFIAWLAGAMLSKIQGEGGGEISWMALARGLIQALDGRHIQVQMDDPGISALLAARDWDGVVRPGPGDFLMVIDSNMGFNKVNARVATQILYQVDLGSVQSPKAQLVLTHTNPSAGQADCRPGHVWNAQDYTDITNGCYWDYLRVYALADAELVAATPHYTTRKWMLAGRAVPRKIDVLNNYGLISENPSGLQAYGTLLVVPPASDMGTRFDFLLPAAVVNQEMDETWSYQLTVRKQAGTRKVPLVVTVELPPGAQLIQANPEGHFSDGIWRMDARLWTDVDIRLTWRTP